MVSCEEVPFRREAKILFMVEDNDKRFYVLVLSYSAITEIYYLL
jgi:hypothetical protein